jgi:hypothetical protein
VKESLAESCQLENDCGNQEVKRHGALVATALPIRALSERLYRTGKTILFFPAFFNFLIVGFHFRCKYASKI